MTISKRALSRCVRFFFLCAFLYALPGLAATSAMPAAPVQLTGATMGTYYAIKYFESPDAPKALPGSERLKAGVEQVLEKVNKQMSTYRADSDISRFNASRVINTPFPVAPEVITVVKEAIRIHTLTEGGLDITVGPLVNLWGFGPEKRAAHVPSDAEIQQRRAWTGLDKLALDGNALIKKVPELRIDLSAIAKGYGVDQVADYLESQGVHHYMVDIGGEIRTRGRNAKQQWWRIGIEKPNATLSRGAEENTQEVVSLNRQAVATSGDYRNFFEEGGQRFSHTIDPRTGRPITNKLASISVLSESCMTADGLATGFDVLGVEATLRIADQLNIPVMLIVKTDKGMEVRYSKAFEAHQASMALEGSLEAMKAATARGESKASKQEAGAVDAGKAAP